MQYNEFIRRVRERGNFDSDEEVVQATEIVLAALGERLYRTERAQLASQLPGELKDTFFLEQEPENTPHDVRRFSLEEFYNRVSARLSVGYSTAVKQAKAVMAVLQEAVSAGELADAMETLPDEYRELLPRSV